MSVNLLIMLIISPQQVCEMLSSAGMYVCLCSVCSYISKTTRTNFTNYYTTTTVLRPPGLCPGLPRWAGTRKVKPIGIYWSKRQWVAVASAGHVQICISPQTDNHASIPPLSFLQVGCPSCCPTNSINALKARAPTFLHISCSCGLILLW